jgi:hypothetical protein
MPDETAELRAARGGQLLRERLLVVRIVQSDLHEFVIRERLIERCDEWPSDTGFTDVHDGAQHVRELSQVASLEAPQGSRSLVGCCRRIALGRLGCGSRLRHRVCPWARGSIEREDSRA